uniref:VWFC domain-containing protein n=1 Tax=Scylla olivacea TaxID=85551 RepID=A0A0P4WGX1_SCYOL
MSPPPYGAGWALVTLSNNGTFHYQVFVQGLTVASLTLETRHRRRHHEVSDLTASYRDGWANGTYERPTYRDLDALLRGLIEVVVAADGGTGRRLQGTLSPVAVTEALRSRQPVLLASPQVPMAAAVWVAVDSACVTHYDVMVAGRHPGGAAEPSWSLVLREDDRSWDPRYDLKEVSLEDEVQGWELFSHTLVLMEVSLSRLGAEVSYLDLHLLPNTTRPAPLLTGRVRGVNVPTACLLDPGQSPKTSCANLECILDSSHPPPSVTNKCIDEDKKVYNNGFSWVSPHHHCRMCMCTQGVIQCHDRICPTLDCSGAYTPPDQCCPVCPGSMIDESAMCELNEQRHHVGTVWHPFLAPYGFDKCVSCSCELNATGHPTLKCAREPCPDLPCVPDEMEHVAGSCCARCRPPQPMPTLVSPPPGFMNEGVWRPEDRRDTILNNGGCHWDNKLYENGELFHPRINTIGYYKCLICNCKESNITCVNVKCPTIQCQEIMLDRQECCPHCVNENSTLRPSWENKSHLKPKRYPGNG